MSIKYHSSQTWAGGMPSTFGSSTIANHTYSIYTTYIPDEENENSGLLVPQIIGTPFCSPAENTILKQGFTTKEQDTIIHILKDSRE